MTKDSQNFDLPESHIKQQTPNMKWRWMRVSLVGTLLISLQLGNSIGLELIKKGSPDSLRAFTYWFFDEVWR